MKTFLKLLLFAALCILFANVIITLGECIFDLDALWFRHGEKMNLYSLLAMFLSILPCVLLKQWGIALGSRMSGWRLAEMSFLGFGLHRNAENRLRLMFRRPVSTVAILITPPRLDGSSPYLAFILGPVLLLAPIGFATIAVSVLLRQTPVPGAVVNRGQPARVKVKDGLVLRSEPNSKSRELDVLRDGTLVRVLDETRGWYKLRVGTQTGYAAAKYIEITENNSEVN
jgi:hypothetical protein